MDQNVPTFSEELVGQPDPIFDDLDIHNIRHIKLSNGEDIICAIKASNDRLLVVKHAARIIRIQQADGNVTLMLMKWMTFTDDEVALVNMNNVISYAKVEPKMVEFYTKGVERYLKVEEKDPENEWPDWMDNPNLDRTQIH
jgi:hypothetical protein